MSRISIPKNWAIIVLFNFFVASLIGLTMRYILNFPVSFLNFEFLLHSHSHFVFYAWATMALSTALVVYLLPDEKKNKTSYGLIFWILQFSSYGMLVTFILNGYTVISIVFSSIATFVFYWFAVIFIKDVRKTDNNKLIKYFSYIAVISFVISSFGPYFLAYFSATGKTEPLFVNGALYFYLHFQYDGWFTFAVFALFLHWLFSRGIKFDQSLFQYFFVLLAFSIFPGYALSIIGMTDATWVKFCSDISVLAELIAIGFLIKIFFQFRREIAEKIPAFTRFLWLTAFLSFVLKTVMQAYSIEPEITAFSFSYRPVVIGFLHLIFLCVVSFFIFGFFFEKRLFIFEKCSLARTGALLFVTSTLLTEIVLFAESFAVFYSIAIPSYNLTLFYITILLSLSLLLFLLGQKHIEEKTKLYRILEQKTENEITIRQLQAEVDQWIQTVGNGYFSELTNTAILTEEVGELARIMARKYGDQTFKESDKSVNMADEMADILWVLTCLANQTGVDLSEAFLKNMQKKTERDTGRWD